MLSTFPHLALTWDDLSWLRELTDLPMLVKGVLTAEDAQRAVAAGVDGIIVSNHGGRQVDGAVAALDALVDVRAGVGDEATVLMDGGIRHGADVVKAMALGADAMLVGRPYAYGLAVGGQQGVEAVLQQLWAETDITMALAGLSSVRELDGSILGLKPDLRRRARAAAGRIPMTPRFCNACGALLATSASSASRGRSSRSVFCDLVGSTSLGESTDPEALRARMRRYFEDLRAILERHGGSVEKFVGDAVMAVFGIPVSHEDDALRAVRASWEMREAVAAHGLEARIGINTGEVVVGGQGETLVTGDAVNVAARLEQAAPAGEVLIGPETRGARAGRRPRRPGRAARPQGEVAAGRGVSPLGSARERRGRRSPSRAAARRA